MGSGGFTGFFMAVGKGTFAVIAFLLVGIPFLTGMGLNVFLVLLQSLASILLSLLVSPISIYLGGAVVLLILGARRRGRNAAKVRAAKKAKEAEKERLRQEELESLRARVAEYEAAQSVE